VTPPYNSFPYMHVDDKVLGQSATMLRYVAKQAGLVPADAWAAAAAESQLEQLGDVHESMSPVVYGPEASRDAARAECIKRLPTLFKGLLAQLGDQPFFGGDRPSYVDLKLVTEFDFAANAKVDILAAVPGAAALQRVVDNVNKLPQLQEYFRARAAREQAQAAGAH
jgi:glutathione S-transferase